MRNCDNCNFGSYGLDCNTGVETLYCGEDRYEYEVQSDDCCESHRYIEGLGKDVVLGYDCDGNEIEEFRILRFPFSADITDWNLEPNVDPRFYCLVRSSNGEVWGISVLSNYNTEYIRKYEKLGIDEEVPILVKPAKEMSFYEVAFCGITNNEWYYEGNRKELVNLLDKVLSNSKGPVKKLTNKNIK